MKASYRLDMIVRATSRLIAASAAIFFLCSQVQAQEIHSSILKEIDELAAATKKLRSEVSELSTRLKDAIADRDIILSGVGKHGEIVNLPPGRGNTDNYFFFISVPSAGIPGDSVYSDNGFSGFQGSARLLRRTRQDGQCTRLAPISEIWG